MMQPAPLPCGCPALGSARRAVDRYVVRRSVGSSVCSQGVHAHGEPRIVLTLRGSFTTRYRVATLRADPAHAVFRTGADEHRDVYERDALCLSIALPPDERNVAVRAPFVVAGPSFWHIARHISTEIAHTDQISDLVLSGLCAEVTALVLNS
ncbi:MAG TPA: hypothetical protein VJN22_06490, partial [Candidatus Eremiobacteraceae bacterium]|nr:hypothetical protein [Candidatus Eremiobacteraceae bacterium]